MSRNVRQKYPHTPVKATKRRGSDTSSSSLNLSDDDEHGYSGVEDVEDSDDEDDEHVFAAEEHHIITNASRKRSQVTPRPAEPEDDDADEEAEDDDDDDGEDEAEDEEAAEEETASWDGFPEEADSIIPEETIEAIIEQELNNVERHVRFTGVPDSDSESTSTDSETSDDLRDFFPDIFVDKNNLDPSFRREIENDDNSSNSGSFWDFNSGSQDFIGPSSDDEAQVDSDSTPIATPMVSNVPTAVSTPTPLCEVQELDGYETDGDTTDEDVPEPPVRRKQKQHFPRIEQTSDSDTEKPTPARRGRPRVGRFTLDNSEKKPIAVLNPTTRKMMIFTPQKLSRLDLAPESFNVDFSNQDLNNCSPILSNPGFVMMGAMFSSNTFGDFMNTQPFGPAEAFFPLTSDPPNEDFSDDSFEYRDIPEEDEGETQLRLEDFLTFNDHDSSDEEQEDAGAEWNGIGESSPTRPRTAASGASAATDSSAMDGLHPLLSHFGNNSDAVGAFRRNQINQQLIFSDKASQESLAFSGPYHYGTLRGIKTGSLDTVTAPITPARRQRRSHTIGVSALDVQASPSQKRKAPSSFTDSLHKKQRSISDIDLMQI